MIASVLLEMQKKKKKKMYHKLQGCESYKSYNEMGLWLDLTLSFITKNDRRNMKIEGDAKKEGKK